MNKMDALIKSEELGQFVFSIYLFSLLDYSWWIFPTLLLLPDLSMLGYVFNTKTGAWTYNFFHHKSIGLILIIVGFHWNQSAIALAGTIWFGHAAMDRIFGYGLKFENNFKNTHLGWIGKKDF